MASAFEDSPVPSLNSYDTALCIIPPTQLTQDVNRLRALYDKAYEKWPPHVNLIYPFVAPESLTHAVEMVRATLMGNRVEEFQVCLDTAGFFVHKRSNTVYITDSDKGYHILQSIRRHILFAFGQPDHNFQPHLTIGQSDAHDHSVRDYLVSKSGLLPPMKWQVSELSILVRERSTIFGTTAGPMRVWATIKISDQYPLTLSDMVPLSDDTQSALEPVQRGTTYHYHRSDSEEKVGTWRAVDSSAVSGDKKHAQASFSVASYNVLVDEIHPPPTERYSIILENLLHSSSAADVLVLQEVSDDFLSFLLKNDGICAQYPYATHGPPDQADIGPLTSLRNIVVLSRWRFSWEWLPFEKRHKGSVVLQMEDIGTFQSAKFLPLIVTGVHLTCGLIDSSILAKQSQVKTIIRHLNTHYCDHDWIVAGDFNITTSSYTINAALERNTISAQGASILSSLEVLFSDVGLVDCYFANRVSGTSTTSEISRQKENFGTSYEGEEGATYDPTENSLAANMQGKSYHSRPQRYDRIFVKGHGFRVINFNIFGLPDAKTEERLGSDHWGVRTILETNASSATETLAKSNSITVGRAPQGLSTALQLKSLLDDHNMFPSEDELVHRQQMFELIKRAVLRNEVNTAVETRLTVSFVMVPVGSYRLGVWDPSSDVDCLVIGTISPRIFFALMVQKLRRPEWQEIHILRKVKAASGTMLELEAGGVRFDLQYCVATDVAETWPKALQLPPSDTLFDLPMQSLLKLNSVRDLEYMRRTIPDMSAFRLAYRFIKTWAKNRGIYSSKLGYLGGIHIALLLARVCKLSFCEAGAISPSDIICTFFKTYANFDWKKDIVYDPTYYAEEKPKYYRSFREPLVILSIHPPKVNVAHTATVPSVKTLEQEFKRAELCLSKKDATWVDIAGTGSRKTGAADFLKTYSTYVKIDVQYWGGAVTKGRMLIGWLEYRCVTLLVDINRKFQDIHARIWPARFTKMEEVVVDNDEEYQGCFLIGLAKNDDSGVMSMTDSDRRSAHVSLVTLLNNFAENIRSDDIYFNSSFSWMDASLVKQSELEGLHIDDATWSNTTVFQDDDSDSEGDIDEGLGADMHIDNANPALRSSQRNSPLRVAGGGKLRPADEVLSRLRWDTSFDSSDYVVGYVDRFIGEKEIPIDRWKSEQTDEEFIPMHRVLYFKRRSDGERVWDRERRIDLIFNSGVSGGHL